MGFLFERRHTMKYSVDHIWVKDVQSCTVQLGLSDFAQHEFGEVVFVELPAMGTYLRIGSAFANVESVKTVTELTSPIEGRVIRVNEAIVANPKLVNESAEDRGWFVEIELENRIQQEKHKRSTNM
jgi:glycine cleavage system H protein